MSKPVQTPARNSRPRSKSVIAKKTQTSNSTTTWPAKSAIMSGNEPTKKSVTNHGDAVSNSPASRRATNAASSRLNAVHKRNPTGGAGSVNTSNSFMKIGGYGAGPTRTPA